jgi:hypothetical protein
VRIARHVAQYPLTRTELVEAAGIEPLFPLKPNPMMANDFGFCDVKTLELP